MSRITLYGFYIYSDKQLFSDAPLYERFNKEQLVELILAECGDLYTYHQQPDYLKKNITNWFTRKYEDFKRMYDALYSEYDPIENYNRYEHWSDSISESTSESTSGSASDSTSDSTSNSQLSQVSPMNTNNLLNDSAANGQTAGASSALTTNSSHQRRDHLHYLDHEGRLHGNIGVTTTQQMIESELELREYDLYERIAQMFERELMVQLY